MRIIFIIITPIIIIWAVRLLFEHIESKNTQILIDSLTKENVVVKLPKSYLVIGIFGFSVCVFFLLIYILFPNYGTGRGYWVYVGLFAFSLLGLIPIIVTVVWRITFSKKDDYFVYRNCLGKKYIVKYDECLNYRSTNNAIVLRTQKHKFIIDPNATNLELFLAQLTKNHIRKV